VCVCEDVDQTRAVYIRWNWAWLWTDVSRGLSSTGYHDQPWDLKSPNFPKSHIISVL